MAKTPTSTTEQLTAPACKFCHSESTQKIDDDGSELIYCSECEAKYLR